MEFQTFCTKNATALRASRSTDRSLQRVSRPDMRRAHRGDEAGWMEPRGRGHRARGRGRQGVLHGRRPVRPWRRRLRRPRHGRLPVESCRAASASAEAGDCAGAGLCDRRRQCARHLCDFTIASDKAIFGQVGPKSARSIRDSAPRTSRASSARSGRARSGICAGATARSKPTTWGW